MRNSNLLSLVLFLFLITGAGGCTNDNDTENTAGLQRTWRFTGFVDAIADTMKIAEPQGPQCYILTFNEDSTFNGSTSTNQIAGKFKISDQANGFRITQFGGTKINELQDGERYVEAILDTYSYSLTKNELRLFYGKDFYLRFKPL
jgi:heat shock protein HslJ